MLMKPLAKLIAGTATALILATGGPSATTILSFGLYRAQHRRNVWHGVDPFNR